jgi:hypothetical protein
VILQEGFIIVAKDSEGTEVYCYSDRLSGGYPDFSYELLLDSHCQNRMVWKTKETAENYIQRYGKYMTSVYKVVKGEHIILPVHDLKIKPFKITFTWKR